MNRSSIISFAFVFCILSSIASAAQTVAIGTDGGRPGESVVLPVNLTATMNCTALLLRLEFDGTRLENPSVTAGAMISTGHTIDCFSPEPGRVNIAIYATDGAPAFTALSGLLFNLNFTIKAGATPGDARIKLTTTGTASRPAANLIKATGGTAGIVVPPGIVTVEAETGAGKSWRQYQ